MAYERRNSTCENLFEVLDSQVDSLVIRFIEKIGEELISGEAILRLRKSLILGILF